VQQYQEINILFMEYQYQKIIKRKSVYLILEYQTNIKEFLANIEEKIVPCLANLIIMYGLKNMEKREQMS